MNKPVQRELRQVVKIGKLKGRRRIYEAAAHNLRELAARHGSYNNINLSRSKYNFILRGPDNAKDVDRLAIDLMNRAGIHKLRKDAVLGVEIVFSLPPEFSGDSTAFFEEAVSWAEGYYKVPLISAVVHCDQGQLHCHVILLPLLDGRMRGSDLVGNIYDLRAAQESFSERVGQAYGLAYKSNTLSADDRPLRLSGRDILALVRQEPSLLDNESVFEALARAIKPTTALLEAVQKTASPENSIGFGSRANLDSEKPIWFESRAKRDSEKPIGFGTLASELSTESLSCVGEVSERDGVTRRKITPRRRLRKRITTSAKEFMKQITSRAAD